MDVQALGADDRGGRSDDRVRHALQRRARRVVLALDARSGKLLWQTNLGPSVASSPMTYAINGKQYVSVMAGNSLFTFGLREK